MKIQSLIIWFLSTLFFIYDFYLRILVGVYQVDLMNVFHLNFKEFSLLSSTIFCLIYGIMQIPVGILINKFKLKKTIALGVLICSISCFGFSLVKTFSISIFWRFIMGFGSSFGFLTLLMTIRYWINQKYIAFFIGLSQCISTIVSVLMTNILYSWPFFIKIGWRKVFFYSGVFGLILFFLVIILVRDKPITNQLQVHKKSLIAAFFKFQPWLISLLSSCIYFIIEYFAESNGKRFLFLKNIEKPMVAFILTFSWIGYAIGNPILGFVSDFYKTRKKIIILCSIIGCLSILTIIFSVNYRLLILGFLFLGFSASGQSIGYANISDNYSGNETSIGFAIENAMITVVSISIATMTSYLIDYFKKSHTLLISYMYSFQFFVLMYIFVFVASVLFLKENVKKQ